MEKELPTVIRTPDQRLRVFISSTLGELAVERGAARRAVERLGLWPVMFELGARPHPPRDLYRAYLAQSHIFVGIYGESYGWVAPGESISGLEDEYRRAGGKPRLLYIKAPAPNRDEKLRALLKSFKAEDVASYKSFAGPSDLEEMLRDDLALLLAERFEASESRPAEVPVSVPPVPLTETVGRKNDAEGVARLLSAGGRLVTLTGPGGVGKTRLALEVARLVRNVDDRAQCYVPLAPVSAPDLALRTIADRLGVRPEGRRSVIDSLVEHLAAVPTLLILDNLEQVADVGPSLIAVLELCADLRILTTSRQPLRVRGEREVRVPPLPVPDGTSPLHEIAQAPAIQLFVAQAQSVAPGFELTADNASLIALICSRLDGLPLAIELAAARVRAMSPALLLDRLEVRSDILSGGASDLPERQRTLRSTIDWTYELLTEEERTLFARLSVFAGGWSLDAAEVVCGEGLASAVLDVLSSLLDKSLVTIDNEDVVAEPRFRMLETIRTYATERLRASGEEEKLRRRHLDWYRTLADEAQPFLCGPGQRAWAARFDPERANLRVAVDTAFADADIAAVVEFVWDVIVFYIIRDALEEPQSWFERVDAYRPQLDDVTSAKLGSLGELMRIAHGDYSTAREPLESALRVFRSRAMDFEAAVCLHQLGLVHYVVDDDVDAGVAALMESSRLFESVHHDWGVSLAEAMLGSLFVARGELDVGEHHHRISLERARSIDNEPLVAQALVQLGLIQVLRGDPSSALPPLGEAVHILREGRFLTDATYCLDAIAGAAVYQNNSASAVRALAVAEAVRRRLGTSVWPMFRAITRGFYANARSHLGDEVVDAAFTSATDEDIFDVLVQTYDELAEQTAPTA